jgi:hypothetical protein
MRKTFAAFALLSALVVGSCDFSLTDPNFPPPIGPNATPDQVKSAAVGLLVALRLDVTRWVLNNGILGREAYRLDTADPRFTTELLAGPLDPSNDAFGGGQWAAEYRAITSGYAILNVIGSAQIPAGQQDAARGFVHTMQAVAFLMILNSHTQDSIPIDVNRGPDQPLAPFVSNDSGYKHVLVLLDSGRTELQTATAFSFDPGPGFVGFNTPSTFLKINRALAARVQAYRASPATPGVGCTACWDTVLTDLAASFIDPAASLDVGAYHVYSTGNQDLTNGLSQDVASAIQLAHPMVKDSAELQNASSLLDRRLLAKVADRKAATATLPDTFSLACLKSALSWIRYPTPNSAIPMIRNEELFLLRAEANWFGATGSKAQAVSDLNFIRQTSGNLAPTTVTPGSTDAEFVNALLHERLYSLMYEGHRWVDMRRYGRLNQIIIDRPTGCPSAGIPKDTVFSTLPINLFEVQARQ